MKRENYPEIPEQIRKALTETPAQTFSMNNHPEAYVTDWSYDTSKKKEDEVFTIDVGFMKKRAEIWNQFAEDNNYRKIGSVLAYYGPDSHNGCKCFWCDSPDIRRHCVVIDIKMYNPDEDTSEEFEPSAFLYVILDLEQVVEWKTFMTDGKFKSGNKHGIRTLGTYMIPAKRADYENWNTITETLEDYANAMDNELKTVRDMLIGHTMFINRATVKMKDEREIHDRHWISGKITEVTQNKYNPYYSVKMEKCLHLYENKQHHRDWKVKHWNLNKDDTFEMTMFIDVKRRMIFQLKKQPSTYYLNFHMAVNKNEEKVVNGYIRSSYQAADSYDSFPDHFEPEWLHWNPMIVPVMNPSQTFEINRNRYNTFFGLKQLRSEDDMKYKEVHGVFDVRDYKITTFSSGEFLVRKKKTIDKSEYTQLLSRRIDDDLHSMSEFFRILLEDNTYNLNKLGREFVNLKTFTEEEIIANAKARF